MARLLYIVARDKPGLHGYLQRAFADEPEVQILFDRRQGADRRQQSVQPYEPEQRRGDRRRQPGIAESLRSLGYAMILQGQSGFAPPGLASL